MDSFEDIRSRHITGTGHVRSDDLQGSPAASLQARRGAGPPVGHGYPITDFTEYSKSTTSRIANHVDRLAKESGRPRITFD
jgi:hypothetical protein